MTGGSWAGEEADPQQCRNARGVAARGGGRDQQTPDARLRLPLLWAAGRWPVQLMSLRAPHALPVPLGVHSRRTRRALRRSTRDPARYGERGGSGLGWLAGARRGAVRYGSTSQLCHPLPDHPLLRGRLRGPETGDLGRRPRRHVLGALAHHLHSGHPRRVGDGSRAGTWREGLARALRGWWPGPSLGFRSDRPASANYCGCDPASWWQDVPTHALP